MNAFLYINNTGCQWRMLPKDFASWQTGYLYFRKWKNEGVIEDECPSKFQVISKRRIVERFFSGLENYRRLTIDYEFHVDTAKAIVQMAFVQIML